MPRISEPRPGEPITIITLKSGAIRYRAVADVGTARKRKQQRRTFLTLSEARTWLSEVRTDSRRGVHVARSAVTFDKLADTYLRLAGNRVRPVSVRGYTESLTHARAAFGTVPAQEVTRDDIIALVDDMAARGLSVRTVSGTLVHVRAVFELGIEDRIVMSNPARKVKPRGKAPADKQTHTEVERAKLKQAATDDWLSACWLLTMAGLRRSEVLGLRWSDVDFTESTVAIRRGRVLVDSKTIDEGDPKTHSSARVLELSPEFMDALKAMRTKHVQFLGLAHMRDGHLAVTEFGQPIRPELYSDHWKRLCTRAKVRVLTLHEERHSSVSLLRAKGVPDQVIAAFHGHDEQTMRRTYSHLQPGDLRQAAASL